ncbi:M23 family metallopeptidase [Chryseobacterium sp. NEB161]|nr:M23 family metallopeptidase [Chryseobacterium sp. NEB161]
MPLKNKIIVTSSYGTRTHPIFRTKKTHNGIDLKASYENVYSVLDGIVTATGWDSKGGGNYIKVKHFNRFETSYLHLSEIYYRVGEKVKAGFIIGKSGNTGNSTGPHLHFSVKEFGQSINPSHFLNDLIKVNNLIANHYEH